MPETVLRTKFLLPQPRPQLLARPRLSRRLAGALEVPLTLVSAPPGAGKTTATAMAARRLLEEEAAAVVWLALDSQDNEPVRFWRYFFAGLAAAGLEELGAPLEETLRSPQPVAVQPLLTQLVNGLANQDRPLLYVLDDLHLIDDSAIHQGLGFLIEHAPPALHLLLATRADPPLPLHRLRARGQLLEVRAADLRFDQGEVATFLSGPMGLSLSSEQIESLAEQTEGWAAGLQLAALALQGQGPETAGRPDLIERLGQSNRYIAEYLAEEVLAQQPQPVQRFLLQSSILERLCGPLCDAVIGTTDGTQLLQNLARRNLFVVPVAAPLADTATANEWYRYHQLFADLLRGHLHQQDREVVPRLHRRAAAWYEAQGAPETAIEHALAGEAYEQAVRLIDAHATQLAMTGEALRIERWLRRLPPEWHHALPRASLAFAWTLLLRGRYAEIEPYLQQAEKAVGDTEDPLWAESQALRASLAGTRGEAKVALHHAQQALVGVPQENQFVQALATFALAGARRELGDVPAAVAAYEQAVPLCRAARLPVPEMLGRAHLAYLYVIQGQLRQAEAVARPALSTPVLHPAASAAGTALAHVLVESNRLDEAEQHLDQALALARRLGHVAAAAQGRTVLARLRRAQGDLAGARTALEEAATLLVEGVPPWVETLLMAERVALALQQGSLTTAAQLLEQGSPGANEGHVRHVLPILRARLLFLQGQIEASRKLVRQLFPEVEQAGHRGRLIELLLLQALLAEAERERQAARQALLQALALAEPEGYTLVFLEAGSALAPLLARVEGDYAQRLLAAYPESVQEAARQQENAPQPLAEPLTERELEVLALMAEGLTYQAIADRLVVSVNTVRHHVKGLYGKLQVDKRTLALQKARELKLL